MTNPISKAIVKAAVAMGYGKKSDYKGYSVADVLEKFAAIAKDKGGSSGGGTVYATFTKSENKWTCDKTFAELKAAYDAGSLLIATVGNLNTIAGAMQYAGMDIIGCAVIDVSQNETNKIKISKTAIMYANFEGTDTVDAMEFACDVAATNAN